MTEIIDIRPFAALSSAALHDILKLRFDIFILEQQSLYPELDGRDPDALHLTATKDGALCGVLRILPGDPVVIGRVAVAAEARGTGLAGVMMTAALERIESDWSGRKVKLGAQQHLEAFYARFGFQRSSNVYDDGGIPHIDMIRG